MVAARAANPAPDASNAPALGSLLLRHRSIRDPRWRLDAVVRLVPVCKRFGIPLDGLREELRRGVRAATCAPKWREHAERMLFDTLEQGCVASLAWLVEALWTRDERGAAYRLIAAQLARGDYGAASVLASHAEQRRYSEQGTELVYYGYVPQHGQRESWPRVIANLDAYNSELYFKPSLPLLAALIDTICRRGEPEREVKAERIVRLLQSRERPIGEALLTCLTLRFESPNAALARVRAIRQRSIRAGGCLLLARSANDIDAARRFTDAIETELLRDVGMLELARRLYHAGHIRDALRLLARIDDPRLAAERLLLHAELRLTVRRDSESFTRVPNRLLNDAYTPTVWTEIRPRLAVRSVHDLLAACVYVRAAKRLDDPMFLDAAERMIASHCRDDVQRRWLLDLLERSGVDIDEALAALQRSDNVRVLAALRAEHVALLAERSSTASLNASFALGLAGEPIANADARSLERALYDEGVSLSAAAPTRRRVLIATAQTCLRSALNAPSDWPHAVTAARLRTLVHLEGGLARDAIVKALCTLPAHVVTTPAAIDTLTLLDAPSAARVVLDRANELALARIDIARLLQSVELAGAVPRGFARAFMRARAALERQLGDGAHGWLADLVALMRTRPDALLTLLEGLTTSREIPAHPSALLAQLDEVPQQFVDCDHVTIASKLARDAQLIDKFLLARPVAVDPSMLSWTTARWQSFLRLAADHLAVHAPQAHRFARRIGRPHWFEALRRADLVQLGAIANTSFAVNGVEYRMQLLDKRLDILTWLRFADVQPKSCFRSDCSLYESDFFRTKEATIEAWKDPLTFCFRLARWKDNRFAPCGFFFGSFATVQGQPAVLMNSLHVQPNDAAVRKAIVAALERTLCEPLQISHVGIANIFNGQGALPETYAKRSFEIMRYRALLRGDWPVADCYDDLTFIANEPTVEEHLYWRAVS